jgi:hypothetical protein
VTFLDGQKEDGLMVANHLELGLGEQGREKEFVGAGRRANLGGDIVVLRERTRVLGAVVVERRKVENVTAVGDAFRRVFVEAVELRVEIPYRVYGAVSVVTHFGEVLLLLLFLQGKVDYREGVDVVMDNGSDTQNTRDELREKSFREGRA